MPPTIQSQEKKRAEEGRRSGSHQLSKPEFVCRVKYNNHLPDIPFDAKFIAYPFEANRFVQYKPTSLEKNYKHELLTDVDLGVNIDLIDPDTYAVSADVNLHPIDEKLLEEEPIGLTDQKRSRQHNKTVSWLRKTEYISTEYNRFQTSNEQMETKVGYSMKKKFQGTDVYKDRESQVEAIQGTFESAKRPIYRHPSKRGIKPVDVLPVFPDFQMWSQPCAHVIFDTDPSPRGGHEPAKPEEMCQAMIRGMVDVQGDQFVAYFLPENETLRKRKRDQEDEKEYTEGDEYHYKMAREYNWNVKNKASKGYEENYVFVFREEGVFYDELVTRVRLSKRRTKGGAGGVKSTVSKLLVKHRELTEQEEQAQNSRHLQLENVVAENEEDDEEVVEENDQSGDENKDDGEKQQDGEVGENQEESNEKKAESSAGEESGDDSGEDIFGDDSD
ncbi:RNA polymerase II-associated factor 1 homolog [Paramuricea clavata]|uniref:RNA polymerase II-associated factor 1 homolog n=1 Tax=Paramuricea clavata TaxID=317549 RepID=A0A6S7FXE3_PARCT|nr:RNA polymerase II-associated factor 1 homolog [Paramuricea clavata]